MMDRLLRILFLSCLLAAPTAHADTQSDAFRAVVGAQSEAFRRDDWPAAFGYASPGIQSMFGSVDRFRRMVLEGYEPVARPRVFEFEPPTVIDGRPAQPVFVIGPDGVPRRAIYFMERQPDGTWLIDGCVLVPVADRTT